MFSKFKSKLKKLRDLLFKPGFSLGRKIKNLFKNSRSEDSFEELEQLFFESDLGATYSMELVERVRAIAKKNPEFKTEEIIQLLREDILKVLIPPTPSDFAESPHVIFIVGVNGSGKTTSVAKLARYYQNEGKKVMLVAADTFRAAAVDQLTLWAERLKVDIIKSQSKSDSSAVIFDALSAAKARNVDIVLIDTAGRLQTKTDLMHELEKNRRVCQKHLPNAPHETILVVDATTGQNAIDQAKIFHQYTPISSLFLSKLDGSAKGGIVVAIQKELNLPIKWIGVGEKDNDLTLFEPEDFVDALLAFKE